MPTSAPKMRKAPRPMACIVGLCELETGDARFLYTPDRSDASLLQHIYDNAEIGTVMSTDELRAYKKIEGTSLT